MLFLTVLCSTRIPCVINRPFLVVKKVVRDFSLLLLCNSKIRINVRNIANRFSILVCIEKFERVAFPFMSKKWQMWKINQSFKYFKQEFTHAVYVQQFDSIIVWTGIAFNIRKLFISSPNMTNSNTLTRQRLPLF